MLGKYQSIQQKISLPDKYNVNSQTKLFPPYKPNQPDNIFQLSQPLLYATNLLAEQLNISFEIYRDPQNFIFKFPDTLFPDVPIGSQNLIQYQTKAFTVSQQNTFRQKLNQQQLQQIEKNGTFQVRSSLDQVTRPYVWKINQFLFWGDQKIKLIWYHSLAKIFGIIKGYKDRFIIVIDNFFEKMKNFPKKIFATIFGIKSIQKIFTVDYNYEITLDFWKKIMKNYEQSQQWSSALWNYLYIYYNPELQRPIQYGSDQNTYNINKQNHQKIQNQYNKKNQQIKQKIKIFKNIHQSFKKYWEKLKLKIIIQIQSEISNDQQSLLINNLQNQNEQKILEKIAQKKFSFYLDYLKTQLPNSNVPINVINALIIILQIFRAISCKYKKKQKLLDTNLKSIQKTIRQQHPIKSLYSPYFQQILQQKFQPIKKAIQDQFYKTFCNDQTIIQYLGQSQKKVYQQFLKLRSNYHILQQAKRNQIKQIYAPTRTFDSYYDLLPSNYQIINNNGFYHLKTRSNKLIVDTNNHFWKIKLYWMRLKTWTVNCLVFLIKSAWTGPTGLRCLYGLNQFDCQKQIKIDTGQIYNIKRKTVIGVFRSVLDGVSKSRQAFQNQPDLGILGKSVSRIFNYIQCYIFRVFIVGIIFCLIGYPIIIILFSLILLILILTVWLWIPIILIIIYLFNLFIYQFENISTGYQIKQSIPIFIIIFTFIYDIILFIIRQIVLLLWAIIKIIFLFIYCILQHYLRKIFDSFMLCLFKKMGRTPSQDTIIAKKIDGPGVNNLSYNSIKQQDVYVLVQSQLENIYIKKYKQLIQKNINQTKNKSNLLINTVLKTFHTQNNNSIHLIHQNIHKLLDNFNQQYSLFITRFPTTTWGIRFTQQQLDTYFDNTIRIVQNFVKKNKIQNWIFQQYNLYQNMYKQLTRSIWMSIFQQGQQIFQPVQKLDSRLCPQDNYIQNGFSYSLKQNVSAVIKAIQGQIHLSHNIVKTKPYKYDILNRQLEVSNIDDIMSLFELNRLLSINLDRNRIQTIYIPNLNIQQIDIIHKQKIQNQIKYIRKVINL